MIVITAPTPIHDLRYTEQKEIFETMDTDSLQINLQKFIKCLHDTRWVDHWPAMQISKQRIEEELKKRGIEVNTK